MSENLFRITKVPYTFYAEGEIVNNFYDDGSTYVSLDDQYIMILYYYFKVAKHRRLYICCNPLYAPGDENKFPECKKKLAVIKQLRGRSFDRFKQASNFLNKKTNGDFYRFKISFFWQLSILCETGKNNNKNILKLYYQYKEKNSGL